MAGMLGKFAAVAGAALGGIGLGKAVELAAGFEQAEVAMSTMLQSADEAKNVLAELTQFAADTTFEFPELLDASKKLVGFGVAGSDVLPTLRSIGDVAAGVSVPIAELAEVFGRNLAAGRLYMKDINEFQGRGIPVVRALGEVMGKTRDEVLRMVEDGQVGSAELIAAFDRLTGAGGQFNGLMAAQSKTLSGLFSKLKDNVGFALRDIGQTIVKELDLKDVVADATKYVAAFGKMVSDGFRVAGSFVRTFADEIKLVAAAMGVAALAIGAYRGALLVLTIAQKAAAAGQAILLALQGPKGWAILAGAAVATAAALGGVALAYSAVTAEVEAANVAADKQASAAQKSAQSIGNYDAAATAAATRAKEANESARKLSESLDEQARQIGLTSTEWQIYKLQQDGADAAMIANLRTQADQLDSLRAMQSELDELAKAAERWADDIASPFEKLSEQLDQVDRALDAGLVSAEMAAAIREKMAADFGDQMAKAFNPRRRPDPVRANAVDNQQIQTIERRFTAGFQRTREMDRLGEIVAEAKKQNRTLVDIRDARPATVRI
jgi:tape measure domain-containing protein